MLSSRPLPGTRQLKGVFGWNGLEGDSKAKSAGHVHDRRQLRVGLSIGQEPSNGRGTRLQMPGQFGLADAQADPLRFEVVHDPIDGQGAGVITLERGPELRISKIPLEIIPELTTTHSGKVYH